MSRFIQHLFFISRFRCLAAIASGLRKIYYGWVGGMQVGNDTKLPVMQVTWPHQVSIGNSCRLEEGISFKYDGIWCPGKAIRIEDHVFIGAGCEFNIKKHISIGKYSLIASGCRFIDHNHGTALNELMYKQICPEKEIVVGENVWIGANVVVLMGVEIGEGAIIGAGAVVTKSVPACEIWAGIPARKIGERR